MPTKRIAVSGVLIALLSGCAGYHAWEREGSSQFMPFPDGTWRLRTKISLDRPDDPQGERIRMGYLDGWLRSEGLCASGYEVTSRHVTPQGLYSDVVYTGRCAG
jgi:hypothetical protein